MISIFLLSIGALLCAGGWWLLKSDKNFMRQSHQITGTCVRLVKRTFRSRDGQINICWFKIYQYEADGRLWELEGTSGLQEEYTVVIGKPVAIRVANISPAKARSLEDISSRQGLVAFMAIAGVIAIMFGTVLFDSSDLGGGFSIGWPALLVIALAAAIQLIWPQIQYLLPLKDMQQFMPATEVERESDK
ncbi:hypothetical protein [Oceanobacter mangrovi]|uniref:hypothetical protein n=1 Tax=Oceanobacter mangrovi TaxID=2862510 RepID=UPI001C8F1BBC|nr:hypothetical protein [Oceanobacter mangrovi]